MEIGIDLREFYPSVEWDILSVPAERHEKYYSCCNEPYLDIFFNITLRRKTLFYTVNLIIPCVGISYLSVLAFYLPADSGEKIALCINILLSQTMFFLLISEIIPSTSLALPLLGKYLLFTMVLVALSVVVTIIILNVHYRKPNTHKMAKWVRSLFIKRLPKILLMRVPDDLMDENKIYGRSGLLRGGKAPPAGERAKSPSGKQPRTKFEAAVAAATAQQRSNSLLSNSPENGPRIQIAGCNGIDHTTHAHHRFTPAHYGPFGLTPYTGLPVPGMVSASGIECESMSDIAAHRKYPFELEKAIHNVMFIQHHIQRQDDFNSVLYRCYFFFFLYTFVFY